MERQKEEMEKGGERRIREDKEKMTKLGRAFAIFWQREGRNLRTDSALS